MVWGSLRKQGNVQGGKGRLWFGEVLGSWKVVKGERIGWGLLEDSGEWPCGKEGQVRMGKRWNVHQGF